MPAPKRKNPSKRIESQPPVSALRVVVEGLDAGWRKTVEACRRYARRATKEGHPVEAGILAHIAIRLSAPGNNLTEVQQTLAEVEELSGWLPLQEKYLQRSHLEQKVATIQAVRRQRFDSETESMILKQATQSPGRPIETRGVAVRALELRNNGKSWAQIESRLLPHRRGVQNPGQSIRREVQFLQAALRKYGVKKESRSFSPAKQSIFQS